MLPFLRLCDTPISSRPKPGLKLKDLPREILQYMLQINLDPIYRNDKLVTLQELENEWNSFCNALSGKNEKASICAEWWETLWIRVFGEGWPPIPLEAETWRCAFRKAYEEIIQAENRESDLGHRYADHIADPEAWIGPPLNAHLMDCAASGFLYLCKLFVGRGACVNYHEICNSCTPEIITLTPLCNAVLNNHFEVAEYLLNKGADPNFIDQRYTGQTLLCMCAKHNKIDDKIINLLLQRGATDTINHKDKNGKTALHLALERSNVQLASILLNWNADPNISDNHGITAYTLMA